MLIDKILSETKVLVWPIVKSYLKDPIYPKQFKITNKYKKEIDLYWQINSEYPSRMGKYLRPTLVRLIAEAFGNKSRNILKIATAMQISEEWILISDDIEDKSENRRGKKTLHKLYGQELAINASNTLETIMWRAVFDCKDKKITDEFYKIILRTTLGQAVEQIWTNNKTKPDKERYFFIADSKSAYYSIAGPMRLGAIASKAKEKQINKITDFGLHLGRCFQLIDDILDYKQDKKEGKQTLANTFGVNYTKKLAEEEKQKALEIFEKDLKFLKHQPAQKELLEIVEFILERKY